MRWLVRSLCPLFCLVAALSRADDGGDNNRAVTISHPTASDNSEVQQLKSQLEEMRSMIELQAEQIELLKEQVKQLDNSVRTSPSSTPEASTEPAPTAVIQGSGISIPPTLDELDGRTEAAIERIEAANGEEFLCPGVHVGYDRGFFIASPEGVKIGHVDVPFLLKTKSRVQVRHTLFDSDVPTNTDRNEFELERARLVFKGHVYRPYLRYYVQLDGDVDNEATFELLDYFFEGTFSEALGWESCRMGVKLGKWKSPFGRQRIESSGRLQLVDRALANEFFQINRNTGIALYGSGEICYAPHYWEVAVINGFQTGGLRPAQLDRNFGYAGHMYFDLLDRPEGAPDPWRDGEPDLAWSPCPALRVGMSGFFTRIDAEGPAEFDRPLSVDKGTELSTLLAPLGVTAFSMAQAAVDTGFKHRGLSIWTEYFWRSVYDYAGADPADLFDHGIYMQGGYFLVPQHLELVARYSVIWGDSSTLGAEEQESSEIALGLNWYMLGHNLKLSSDLTWLDGAPVNSSSANIRPGDDGLLWRTQFQMAW